MSPTYRIYPNGDILKEWFQDPESPGYPDHYKDVDEFIEPPTKPGDVEMLMAGKGMTGGGVVEIFDMFQFTLGDNVVLEVKFDFLGAAVWDSQQEDLILTADIYLGEWLGEKSVTMINDDQNMYWYSMTWSNLVIGGQDKLNNIRLKVIADEDLDIGDDDGQIMEAVSLLITYDIAPVQSLKKFNPHIQGKLNEGIN